MIFFFSIIDTIISLLLKKIIIYVRVADLSVHSIRQSNETNIYIYIYIIILVLFIFCLIDFSILRISFDYFGI